jgi:Restriction endonuclease
MNTSLAGMAAAYPDAIVVRSVVIPNRPYGDYLQNLRYDFWFSCAYCSIAEAEAVGISFEIDHYEPQSTEVLHVHDYSNLMYSCSPCNLSKSNIWTSPEQQAQGLRFLGSVAFRVESSHLAV